MASMSSQFNMRFNVFFMFQWSDAACFISCSSKWKEISAHDNLLWFEHIRFNRRSVAEMMHAITNKPFTWPTSFNDIRMSEQSDSSLQWIRRKWLEFRTFHQVHDDAFTKIRSTEDSKKIEAQGLIEGDDDEFEMSMTLHRNWSNFKDFSLALIIRGQVSSVLFTFLTRK